MMFKKIYRKKTKSESGSIIGIMGIMIFPSIWYILGFTFELLIHTNVQSTIQSAVDASVTATVSCNKEGQSAVTLDQKYTIHKMITTYELNRTTDSLGNNLTLFKDKTYPYTAQNFSNECRMATGITPQITEPAYNNTICIVEWWPALARLPIDEIRLALNEEADRNNNSACSFNYYIDPATNVSYVAVMDYQKSQFLPSFIMPKPLRHFAFASSGFNHSDR